MYALQSPDVMRTRCTTAERAGGKREKHGGREREREGERRERERESDREKERKRERDEREREREREKEREKEREEREKRKRERERERQREEKKKKKTERERSLPCTFAEAQRTSIWTFWLALRCCIRTPITCHHNNLKNSSMLMIDVVTAVDTRVCMTIPPKP